MNYRSKNTYVSAGNTSQFVTKIDGIISICKTIVDIRQYPLDNPGSPE